MKHILRNFSTLVALATVLGMSPIAAQAAVSTAPGQNKIQCFSGSTDAPGTYFGTCTLTSKGAKGPAVLNNNDNDTNPYNNYSGVYTTTSNMYGQLIGNVGQLSFYYTGDAATAGSPRFSIPLDTNGDGATDVWAFISAFYCNDGAGFVDAIHDSTCTIYLSDGDSYANWSDMVAEYPTWKIATDNYVFLIADDPGQWTVSGVTFGKPGK